MPVLQRLAVFALVSVAACAPRFVAPNVEMPVLEAPAVSVQRVSLRYSNVYLLRSGSAAVLVDAGSPSDVESATAALANAGLKPSDVKLVVLSHAHGDHAGMAPLFQKSGAKIMVGRGDELQTTVGHNDEMKPTSLFAAVIKPIVRLDYTPFTPDVLVDDEADLGSYGLPGVRVRHMPGHTRGSLVVFVSRREALVGDMMLGGVWGGLFHDASAGEHYYQLEPARNHCNIHALLDQGIERFHLGHGGPVDRDAVLAFTKSWDEPPCPAVSGASARSD